MAQVRDKDADKAVRRVVIVGGGTAGWMSAAGMVSVLSKLNLSITLIESDAIGTVGVGEATLPHIRFFNQKLGIDENELMAATQATYKLGIEFKNWGNIGDSYIHPFGDFGVPINRVPFHHYITRAIKTGHDIDLDEYSLPVMAARGGKFTLPSQDMNSVMSTYGYAYQFDATLYARFLRKFSEGKGVTRQEGKVTSVTQNPENGFITSVTLESGQQIDGDIFIDCTGFRGLLIEQTLRTGFDDWSEYLPCNRAVTVGSEPIGSAGPYTRASAKAAGWQWRIPLQHRIGNGYVYASDYMSDDEAAASLLEDVDGPLRGEPRHLKFVSGMRKASWNKNCIAVGLSGGFLEPLESTGIYLIQEAITNFIELFPTRDCPDAERDEYNRIMDLSFERVRDFLILHYVATQRTDSPFWKYCKDMPIPDSLRHKMDLFKNSGRVVSYELGAFKFPSWLAVYYGQGIIPAHVDPVSAHMPLSALPGELSRLKSIIGVAVSKMPNHTDYIAAHCAADPAIVM